MFFASHAYNHELFKGRSSRVLSDTKYMMEVTANFLDFIDEHCTFSIFFNGGRIEWIFNDVSLHVSSLCIPIMFCVQITFWGSMVTPSISLERFGYKDNVVLKQWETNNYYAGKSYHSTALCQNLSGIDKNWYGSASVAGHFLEFFTPVCCVGFRNE